ncbi:hypothetical protein J4G02_01245 [Candidatus Poribacteria bacterium]|nr:hypothetical protein [Candidatus Poribacteria bacterium]
MANWSEYISDTLERLSGKQKTSALPQISLQPPETTEEIAIYEGRETRREKQVKERLSYQLFEKMRRRTFSWKSYYYYDAYDIPRIAITNENATGTHIIERRHFLPEDRIIEANFFTNANASSILIDANDLARVSQELFDQLNTRSINFQIYNQTYPLEIWFDSDQKQTNKFLPLGQHKICIDDQRAYLLRSFRNLGADGFAALSNRLLAQEGIAVDPKSTIESLLIELGSEELLYHYHDAINQYNQKTSRRRSAGLYEDEEQPLIITKTRQRGRRGDASHRSTVDKNRPDPIPDEMYEMLAFAFEKNFPEIEEDLMHVSLAALSLDRGAVTDGCAILRDKLCSYTEAAVLQEHQLEYLYQFVQRLLDEEEAQEEEVYSPLEDQAYEEILVELLEEIRDITTDFRYIHYPPINTQVDLLQESVQSLSQALEDAEDKQRRREISDKREILTKKAFEVPNPRTYTLDKTKAQISYYERLLEIQKTIHDVQEQASNSAHDVGFSLAKSAYILVQLHLKEFPDLRNISNQLIELMQRESDDNYKEFELEFIKTFAQLATALHQSIKITLSDQLMKITNKLEKLCTANKQFNENNWNTAYTEFVHSEVAAFNDKVRESAIEKYDQVAEQIDYQLELIEIFISGINVPALLPAQLHESGKGLQTFLVEQLKKYLNTQNLQLQSVPGREYQLRSLITELMPMQLDTPLEQLEYFFRSTA